jgi:hypothetical protein
MFVDFSLSGAGMERLLLFTYWTCHSYRLLSSFLTYAALATAAPPNPQISLAQFLEEVMVDGYQGVPHNEIGRRSFGPSYSIAEGGRGQGIRLDIGALLGEIPRAI